MSCRPRLYWHSGRMRLNCILRMLQVNPTRPLKLSASQSRGIFLSNSLNSHSYVLSIFRNESSRALQCSCRLAGLERHRASGCVCLFTINVIVCMFCSSCFQLSSIPFYSQCLQKSSYKCIFNNMTMIV